MTTSRQNLRAKVVDPKYPVQVPVTTDQTIHSGDMVWWDATNGTAKALDTKAHAELSGGTTTPPSGFLGVSEDTTPIELYGNENLPGIMVIRKGTVFLLTTPGEFYPNFQPVTLGSDAQHITLVGVSEANRVGFVVTTPPDPANAAAASTPVGEKLTGATGVYAEVWLEPKVPAKGV